jgi:hypothetical protein
VLKTFRDYSERTAELLRYIDTPAHIRKAAERFTITARDVRQHRDDLDAVALWNWHWLRDVGRPVCYEMRRMRAQQN